MNLPGSESGNAKDGGGGSNRTTTSEVRGRTRTQEIDKALENLRRVLGVVNRELTAERIGWKYETVLQAKPPHWRPYRFRIEDMGKVGPIGVRVPRPCDKRGVPVEINKGLVLIVRAYMPFEDVSPDTT